MSGIKTVITDCDLVTAYGIGSHYCWDGLLSSKSAICKMERFSTTSFQTSNAAILPGLKYLDESSLVMQMFLMLLKQNKASIPSDAFLILATTTGEIDILEKQVLKGATDSGESRFSFLLDKLNVLTGIKMGGTIISNACASSLSALGFASSLIESGQQDCVLVVAADAVTEFVFSGFSSLMALDPDKAKPFDKNRAGLSLGEGAGFVLLMSQARAWREGRKTLGVIAGWAIAGDANHMTGPLRDGSGLKLAIEKALQNAGVSSDDVGCISGHGTGTVYNDSMEMKAYNSIFHNRSIPLYSLKGGVGHTMGASGLIETIIALNVLREKIIPSTVGLINVDPEAKDWASLEKRELRHNIVLLNNSGFGGVNASVVLKDIL